jgi:NADH:ubiquinone oxidoreductase subunit 4 (subunit M)
MAFLHEWILTLLIAWPLVGAALLYLVPKSNDALVRHLAVVITIVELVLSLHLIAYFDPASSTLLGCRLQRVFVTSWVWMA